MAKKVVATLKKEGATLYTKAVKIVKTAKGGYGYEQRIMPTNPGSAWSFGDSW
jgi:hypothetical protein